MLTSLAALALAASVAVATEPETAEAPRIVFDRVAHDFGDSVSGATLETTFTFRNEGTATLEIRSVKGG